jgi:hypothetical protein
MQRFKFEKESKVSFEGKKYVVEVWRDLQSKKIVIVDKETKKKLNFKGAMGEEL